MDNTSILDTSLFVGHLPVSHKTAVVPPLIKKTSLDVHNFKNYRSVSNLSFASKLVDTVAANQLTGSQA